MQHNRITILASYVTELIFHVPRIMRLGETIEGSFETGYGGKGFNMAVAAKRAGGNVNVIMKVGNDVFGDNAIRILKEEGIATDAVYRDDVKPSGAGVVLLMPNGENAIAIDSGANTALTPAEIEASVGSIHSSAVVLSPLEMPIAAIKRSFEIAKISGCTTILNPAPAQELPDDIFQYIDILTPNKTEAEIITGIKLENDADVIQAAETLFNKGIPEIVITRGGEKAYYKNKHESAFIYPPKVNVVDTTGAGDAFNGMLAHAVAQGKNFTDAVADAVYYAALKVTRNGTSKAMPFLSEYDAFRQTVNNKRS